MSALAPSTVRAVVVDAPGGIPEGLLDAFWAYDDALLSNDVAALDDAFAPGPDTIRGDGTTVVVGWEAISRFRAARTVVPTRRVAAVHIRIPADGVAVIVADVVGPTGTPGMQTQVWERQADRWRVIAAHVTAPEKPLDRSTWRVVGTPLVEPTASGPLDGMTVAVKDLFAVAGQVIGGGVPEVAAEAPVEAEHSPVVADLLASGASVLGIASTDQFAYSIAGTNGRTGTPLNVADPAGIPGGSSSGPASATARGWTTIGLGTDTAGSIRVPSAYQGLWGLRTTHGLVPTARVLPLAQSFDSVGWMTRDAATLQAVTDALVPGDPVDEEAPLVVVPSLTALAVPAVADAVAATARALGATVDHTLGADIEAWFHAFRTVQAFEAWRNHGDWITSHPGALSVDVAGRFAVASRVTDAEFADAGAVVGSAREMLREWLGERILLLPTVADRAPRLGADAASIDAHRAATLRLTSLASLAGLPALAAPLGPPTPDGPPVSVCLVGAPGTDRAIVRFAGRLRT